MSLPPETVKLLQAYFAGDPSPEVIEAMEAWLRQDKAHPRILAEYGLVDLLLACEQKTLDASAIFASLLEAEEAAEPITLPKPQVVASQTDPSERDSISFKYACKVIGYAALQAAKARAGYLASAAAILVLGLVLVQFLINADDDTTGPTKIADDTAIVDQTPIPKPPATHPTVATLTNTHNAKWAKPSAEGALAPGSELKAGQTLTLTAGFAEITTSRGAIAILEAPATIELLDNNNAIRLHAGKLVGICETESSKGFVVKTDYADITDIGTEFGVSVLPTGVETTVFAGEIAVKPPNAPTKHLFENDTASVSLQQGRYMLVVNQQPRNAYVQRLPRPAVVTSASISDDRFQVEIAAQGVYEDSFLYSDRDYQINGIDGGGLPAVLIGGDLIRLPADARRGRTLDIAEIQVDIELSQPCEIYLVAAPDHRHLDWIKQDYELTPMRIGQDQSGSFFREQAPVGLGVGPGESIDEVMHVWKHKQPATGRITFGPSTDSSMYSIVAVPTDNVAD